MGARISGGKRRFSANHNISFSAASRVILLAALLWLSLFPGAVFSATQDHVNSPITTETANHIQDWKDFMRGLQAATREDQLVAVNNYFNRMRFLTDQQLWNQVDYWASPLQVLDVQAGDCEDLAVAKYFTLKALGFTDKQLFLTYVHYLNPKTGKLDAHMVLSYQATPEEPARVLDVLNKDIDTLDRRKDFQPRFQLNTEGLWLFSRSAEAVYAGHPSQYPQWRHLSQVMAGQSHMLLDRSEVSN